MRADEIWLAHPTGATHAAEQRALAKAHRREGSTALAALHLAEACHVLCPWRLRLHTWLHRWD